MATESEFYDDEIIDYRYYFDLIKTVLLKNYRSIAAFCSICVIGAVLYVQSQAPVFYATVTLHVAPQDQRFNFNRWVFNDEEKFQDTQIGLLQSNKLLQRVVTKTQLHHEPKLTPASFDAGIAQLAKNWLAGFDDNGAREIPEEDRINRTAAELGSLISISKPPGREYSSLLNVTVRSAAPEISARVANTLAEEYINLVFENEIESARKNQQFLTDRLSILREDLRLAEKRLQEYREEEDIITRASGQDEVDEELAALSNRFFEARENRLRQENLYQQISQADISNSNWDKLPVIASNDTVERMQSELFGLYRRKSELSKRYGSRHNKMIALNSEIQEAESVLANQVRDIAAGIQNEYQLAIKIEKAAEETLNSARDRKQQRGRKEFELNDLTQDVEAKREVYSVFLERLNQDGAAGPVRNDNLWVADPAVVPKSGHRTPLTRAGLIALVLSFGFALGLGILSELTSNTISTGDDVEKKLGTAFLGYLPLITDREASPGLAFTEYIENPHSRFSEALRTLRTSISLNFLNSEGTNTVLVTSSQSSEGKTSVAISLAAAFGHTANVLVIDGDLRKPSIEKILNSSNHKEAGLSDVIAGTSTLDEAIQKRSEENIDVLYAGSRTIKPLELLSSTQFAGLMTELTERYDTIIIDSPPCISVSDAYVLATQVDSVIFVAKSDQVAVPVIRNCLNRFRQVDVEVSGVLLNQIDFSAAHNYGRYHDYYEYHNYGENHAPELSVVSSNS